MSYSELLVALENLIIDKVAKVPTVTSGKADTSTPMEKEWLRKMTVKVREEKEIKESWTSRCELFTKGMAKENGVLERVRVGTERCTMVARAAKTEE